MKEAVRDGAIACAAASNTWFLFHSWSSIGQILDHRSDNDIKNKWYSMHRKEQRLNKKQLSADDTDGKPAPSQQETDSEEDQIDEYEV